MYTYSWININQKLDNRFVYATVDIYSSAADVSVKKREDDLGEGRTHDLEINSLTP